MTSRYRCEVTAYVCLNPLILIGWEAGHGGWSEKFCPAGNRMRRLSQICNSYLTVEQNQSSGLSAGPLWSLQVHNYVHKRPPLNLILNQLNSTQFCFFSLHYYIYLSFTLRFPSDFLPSDFLTKILYACLIPHMRATYLIHFILQKYLVKFTHYEKSCCAVLFVCLFKHLFLLKILTCNAGT
jgi:hypothetical protein